jgi:hypothetical protein
MGVHAIAGGGLATFREEWVSGHLDRLRAAEAVESARQAVHVAEPGEAAGRAAAQVESALQRLAEIEATLVRQFNRFCGLREAPRSSLSPVATLEEGADGRELA